MHFVGDTVRSYQYHQN